MGSAVTVTAPAELTAAVAVGSKTLAIANATPKGKVIVLAVDRQSNESFFTYAEYAEVSEDVSPDGSVAIPLRHAAGRESVWIAVDLVTGRSAVALPPSSPYREITLPAARGDSRTSFAVPGTLAHVAIVRPGIGGWFLSGGDGAAGDTTGQADNVIAFALSSLQPLRGSHGAAGSLLPHDLVIGIDRSARTYFVSEVQP